MSSALRHLIQVNIKSACLFWMLRPCGFTHWCAKSTATATANANTTATAKNTTPAATVKYLYSGAASVFQRTKALNVVARQHVSTLELKERKFGRVDAPGRPVRAEKVKLTADVPQCRSSLQFARNDSPRSRRCLSLAYFSLVKVL